MRKDYFAWHQDKFLWKNNGSGYWMRLRPYDPAIKRKRLTWNLKTHDIEEARRRRDEIMQEYPINPRFNWNIPTSQI